MFAEQEYRPTQKFVKEAPVTPDFLVHALNKLQHADTRLYSTERWGRVEELPHKEKTIMLRTREIPRALAIVDAAIGIDITGVKPTNFNPNGTAEQRAVKN